MGDNSAVDRICWDTDDGRFEARQELVSNVVWSVIWSFVVMGMVILGRLYGVI